MKIKKGKERDQEEKGKGKPLADELDDFIRKKKMQNKVLQEMIEKLKNSK